nr:cupin domain-containing protein [Nocardioides flavescens]
MHAPALGGPPGFRVAHSTFLPGARVDPSANPGHTVYVVLDGAIELGVGESTWTLERGDSVHLPPGTVRTVRNDGDRPAVVLVVAETPREDA